MHARTILKTAGFASSLLSVAGRARAEAGAALTAQEVWDAVRPQLMAVGILLLGCAAVGFALGIGLGWFCRSVLRRRIAWGWFIALALVLALCAVIWVIAGFSAQ